MSVWEMKDVLQYVHGLRSDFAMAVSENLNRVVDLCLDRACLRCQ